MQLLSLSAVRNRLFLLLGAFALAAIALAQPLVGSAHEHRDVGDYTFTVGFINEPAIQGDTNGIWVEVMNGEEPVVGLADTLTAQVIFGEDTRDFSLTPAFGEDGVYEAVFIPTEPGDYTFRFTGQVDGVEVDETFTSAPEGFDSVAPRADLEFPGTGEVGDGDTTDVAMPLAVGAVVLGLGAVGYVARRRNSQA
jgi:hypothetical protein